MGVVIRDGGYILSRKLNNVKNNSMDERKIKQWEPVFRCVYCDFIDLGYQTVSFGFFSHPVICIAQVGTIWRYGANKTIWFLWSTKRDTIQEIMRSITFWITKICYISTTHSTYHTNVNFALPCTIYKSNKKTNHTHWLLR